MTETTNVRQRAAVVVNNTKKRSDAGFNFEIRSVPIPKLKPWEVLVKLSVTGVCGTDVSLAAGHVGPTCDILGHEGVGRVASIGSGVDPSAIKIGDRVGIAWVRDVCGRCPCCREPGGETRCLEQLNSGRKLDGTFAEYCVVPSRYLLTVPDDDKLLDKDVAPVLCGGVTAYKALKMCGATPGEWVAIIGAGGGVGGLAVQYAKAMGYQVAAVDVGPARKNFCLQSGADQYLDALEGNMITAAKNLTPYKSGVKASIVTAGSGKAYQNGLDLLGAFGTLVCVGIPPPPETLVFHPLAVIDRGIRIIGTLVGTRTETLEALEFVRRGVVKPVVNMIRLEDLGQAANELTTVRPYLNPSPTASLPPAPCLCLSSTSPLLTLDRPPFW
ncbi:hypothetical protein jhhlp_008837 [Lomentospora prolificans]|uniref:Enoyl reductase (ER) domain-containing protein n=1 Tax=Lomentospora prolificans TaxID=41688 RepID=A0A2N3MZ62_9PEZI|nr:hypothetical protein jhhlp_008837 [Lomentospora prolificans]